jgi:putative tryptophan/tyrosine transport system substrate-binding protein
LSGELASKRLQLLHELIPHAKTIAVLVNVDDRPSGQFQSEVQAAAHALRLSVQLLPAGSERDIQLAFERLTENRADALLIGAGPFLDSQRHMLVALAAKAAIPDAYETRASALAGGLVSYGARVSDGYRQAGVYVGRILNGAKPAELPVVLATRLELVINRRTANTLGLEIPPSLLARADEVTWVTVVGSRMRRLAG